MHHREGGTPKPSDPAKSQHQDSGGAAPATPKPFEEGKAHKGEEGDTQHILGVFECEVGYDTSPLPNPGVRGALGARGFHSFNLRAQ
jgi:hypothetical protein